MRRNCLQVFLVERIKACNRQLAPYALQRVAHHSFAYLSDGADSDFDGPGFRNEFVPDGDSLANRLSAKGLQVAVVLVQLCSADRPLRWSRSPSSSRSSI